jgi:hypothetical protein
MTRAPRKQTPSFHSSMLSASGDRSQFSALGRRTTSRSPKALGLSSRPTLVAERGDQGATRTPSTRNFQEPSSMPPGQDAARGSPGAWSPGGTRSLVDEALGNPNDSHQLDDLNGVDLLPAVPPDFSLRYGVNVRPPLVRYGARARPLRNGWRLRIPDSDNQQIDHQIVSVSKRTREGVEATLIEARWRPPLSFRWPFVELRNALSPSGTMVRAHTGRIWASVLGDCYGWPTGALHDRAALSCWEA